MANVVMPAPGYVRFAAGYGFALDFCEAADPESKGVVEHLVGYAKADLVVGLCQWPGRNPRWWPRKVPTRTVGQLTDRRPPPRARASRIRSAVIRCYTKSRRSTTASAVIPGSVRSVRQRSRDVSSG